MLGVMGVTSDSVLIKQHITALVKSLNYHIIRQIGRARMYVTGEAETNVHTCRVLVTIGLRKPAWPTPQFASPTGSGTEQCCKSCVLREEK